MVRKICVDSDGYASLLQFIDESFYKDSQGQLIELNLGLYGDSQFYKAKGKFSIVNTCNSWTAKGLKSSGMEISTAFKLTASSVMRHVEKYRQFQKCVY